MAYGAEHVRTVGAKMGNPTNRWSCSPKRYLQLQLEFRRTLNAWLWSGRQLNSMLSGRQSCHREPIEESNPWILGQEKENDVGLTEFVRSLFTIDSVPQPSIVSGIEWRATQAQEHSDG